MIILERSTSIVFSANLFSLLKILTLHDWEKDYTCLDLTKLTKILTRKSLMQVLFYFIRDAGSIKILMMMMNCFCGMVDRRKVFNLISGRDHCQISSPLWISDTPWAGFEPAQNLSSGLDQGSCAVVITTTPWHHIV